jgi:lysozyme
MKLSDRGLALIKRFEGLRLQAYHDIVGVLTIGYGHTGPDVAEDMVINASDAETLLRQDTLKFENGVEKSVKVPLTQGQFDALVSFSYNVGLGSLRKSTLLKKLNAGDYQGASREFERWNRAGGKVVLGLVVRRKLERQVFDEAG